MSRKAWVINVLFGLASVLGAAYVWADRVHPKMASAFTGFLAGHPTVVGLAVGAIAGAILVWIFPKLLRWLRKIKEKMVNALRSLLGIEKIVNSSTELLGYYQDWQFGCCYIGQEDCAASLWGDRSLPCV